MEIGVRVDGLLGVGWFWGGGRARAFRLFKDFFSGRFLFVEIGSLFHLDIHVDIKRREHSGDIFPDSLQILFLHLTRARTPSPLRRPDLHHGVVGVSADIKAGLAEVVVWTSAAVESTPDNGPVAPVAGVPPVRILVLLTAALAPTESSTTPAIMAQHVPLEIEPVGLRLAWLLLSGHPQFEEVSLAGFRGVQEFCVRRDIDPVPLFVLPLQEEIGADEGRVQVEDFLAEVVVLKSGVPGEPTNLSGLLVPILDQEYLYY